MQFMEFVRKLHLYDRMFFGIQRKKYQQLSDKELIDLYITDRCRYTLPILYERYGHLVMGSCMKYLRQVENAEDITMRIFGELGAKLLKHDVQHFKSWLYQVTRNECLQFLRKHKPGETTMISELTIPAGSDETDGEAVQLEQRLQLLEKAIGQLKDEQRTCIELFYLEQRSYNEISEQLSIPLNTVKSAIQNGKRNLKIWMERQASHEA
jgi:RNA polymerase sigma-70 factor (ECF subfamily)